LPWALCQAFIKLESNPSVEPAKRQSYADLALTIFLKHAPIDPRAIRETRDKGDVEGAK
jgi:WD repeat-containing protein 35